MSPLRAVARGEDVVLTITHRDGHPTATLTLTAAGAEDLADALSEAASTAYRAAAFDDEGDDEPVLDLQVTR